MADIYKLQGSIEIDPTPAERGLKKVESSARGTQAALNRIDGRKVGAELSGGFDRGASSAGRLMGVVNGLQAKLNSLKAPSLNFRGAQGGGGGGLGSIGAIAGGNLLSGALSAATGGLTDKLKQGWSAGIEYNKMLEKASISFTTLLGSTDKAQAHLKALQAFGEATPFEFPDLIKASQRMQAMGFSADKVIPSLKNVGDAVSAVGGGKEELDGVVLALGQMQTKGKVSAEEMNQLAERGIPAWDLLAKAIGKSKEETIKLSESGRLSGGRAVEGIVAMMGERFGGQMDKMAATLEGQESNFNDILNRQLGQATTGNFGQLKETYAAATKGLGTEGAKAFQSEIKTLLDKTGAAATGDLSKLASGQLFSEGAKIAGGANSIVDSLGSAGKSLNAGNYGEAFKSLGDAVGKGFELGLKNSQDPVDKAVYDLFSNVITRSKGILGIQSPSTVYQEIGANTVAGFAVGLEAGKGKLSGTSVVDAEKLRAATLAELEKLREDPRIKAMLDTIAKAEGTGSSYNIQFGGGRFSDLSDHPNEAITRKLGGKPITSTAAGRYQFLNRTWEGLEKQLGLSDFGAKNQDLGAIALMKSRGMIGKIQSGDIAGALTAGNREWASLPGSPYGQPTKKAEELITAYNAALEKYNAAAAATAPVTNALSSAVDTAKQKLLEFGASVVSWTGLVPATPAPVPAVVSATPAATTASRPKIGGVTYPGDGATAKPFAGQIGVGAVGSATIKPAAEALTLSSEAAAQSLAGMTAPMKTVPPAATETAKAMETTGSQAGKFADAIMDAGNKTGEATEQLTAHFERFWGSLSNGIDDFIESGFKKDGLKNLGKSLLRDLSSGLISQATGGKANSFGSLLTGALTGKLGGGQGAGGAAANIAASLPGGFAGGANPAAAAVGGASGGSGGIGGAVGSLAGQAKDSLLSGGLGKIPGIGKVGGFLKGLPGVGGIFGKLGGMFGGGGAAAGAGAAGQAAGAAGGILGKVSGALGFAGPVGLIAGIGLQFAAPLLGKLFGGDPLKDYKKFIKSEYGISASNQIAAKVKQIGESKFGAEAPKRKIETVRLPEVRDMLSEYAGAFQKGGNKNLFDSRIFSDQYSAVNQFKVGLRAMGGPVSAGGAYIVGERRPELFIPQTSGRVVPNLDGIGGGGGPWGRMLAMMERLEGVMDRVGGSLDSFESHPPEAVLMKGAKNNPEIITEAFDRSLGGRSEAAVRVRDKLQYR